MDEAITEYDPLDEPEPQLWLAMDEQQRIDLISAYYRRAGISLPNDRCTPSFTVIVENQIADDELPVRRTAQRLMSEGLDRHDAIHAIGSVVAGNIHDLMRKMPRQNTSTRNRLIREALFRDQLRNPSRPNRCRQTELPVGVTFPAAPRPFALPDLTK